MKNSKSIKSRQILLSGLVALVLVAGYYRWTVDNKTTVVSGGGVPKIKTEDNALTGGEKQNEKTTETETNDSAESESTQDKMSYFEKTRYERELSRSNILAAAESTENKDIKTAASEEVEKSEKETVIEGLIKAKGFEDCVVFLDSSGANVVVKGEKLDSALANQIKDIIISKTDFRACDIRISTKAE